MASNKRSFEMYVDGKLIYYFKLYAHPQVFDLYLKLLGSINFFSPLACCFPVNNVKTLTTVSSQ